MVTCVKGNAMWWQKAVVYQIYPRSFMDYNGDGIGDLQGIVQKLDYLKSLGVDVIWLSPIYDSPNDDNGYDIRDYTKIMEEFGTMEDFDVMIEEMHKRDLKLMMDLVVNHTSDEHEWFVQSKKDITNRYRDYYIWRKGENGNPPNNWGSFFSGSAWEYDERTNEYYLHLFSKKQPDLNWENEKVRQEVYKIMRFWLDKGVDGFRMDVINFISKDQAFPDGTMTQNGYGDGTPYFMNGPKIHEFLQEMHREVLAHYDVMTVGEMPGATVEDANLFTSPLRNELNMIFTFEHMDLDSDGMKWNLKPLKLTDLKKNFAKWQRGLHQQGWNSLYWNNHDQPRIVSRFGDDSTYRVQSAKMLGACLHFMQGTPYIYQGEEIGMTNVAFSNLDDYRDIETLNIYKDLEEMGWPHDRIMNAIFTKGRDNARTPMQWSNADHAGFTTGTPWLKVNPNFPIINVENALQDENSIFYFYQRLIKLRKEMPIMTYGDFTLLLEEREDVFCYERTYENETLTVLCNFTGETVSVEGMPTCEASLLLQNYEDVQFPTLRPYEVLVYYKK
ncbi:alpha-glucosidase [Bacillus sp. FJAT-47783]|uniref:glycoside hydrolase family 13 protein n=1 Tax=Bacillus sp. FJAT-47783 TaxID=2922712 RepID=UPI001FAE6666|nr:alpha-glucosidase [Bacillus sp. FJAT-47783]